MPTEQNWASLTPTRNRLDIIAMTPAELRKARLNGLPLWIYDDFSTDPEAIRCVGQTWPGAQVLRGNVP